jgi:hypothetical protein
MDGGLENPLGARALYLFQGNKDTLFRIHGTNKPDSVATAVGIHELVWEISKEVAKYCASKWLRRLRYLESASWAGNSPRR